MITRVLHLSLLYTATLLLQGGRTQLIPNYYDGHNKYNISNTLRYGIVGIIYANTSTYTNGDTSTSTDDDIGQNAGLTVNGESNPEIIPLEVDSSSNLGDPGGGIARAVGAYDESGPEIVPLSLDSPEQLDDSVDTNVATSIPPEVTLEHGIYADPVVFDDDGVYNDPGITVGDEVEISDIGPVAEVAPTVGSSSPAYVMDSEAQGLPADDWLEGPEVVDDYYYGGGGVDSFYGQQGGSLQDAVPLDAPVVDSDVGVQAVPGIGQLGIIDGGQLVDRPAYDGDAYNGDYDSNGDAHNGDYNYNYNDDYGYNADAYNGDYDYSGNAYNDDDENDGVVWDIPVGDDNGWHERPGFDPWVDPGIEQDETTAGTTSEVPSDTTETSEPSTTQVPSNVPDPVESGSTSISEPSSTSVSGSVSVSVSTPVSSVSVLDPEDVSSGSTESDPTSSADPDSTTSVSETSSGGPGVPPGGNDGPMGGPTAGGDGPGIFEPEPPTVSEPVVPTTLVPTTPPDEGNIGDDVGDNMGDDFPDKPPVDDYDDNHGNGDGNGYDVDDDIVHLTTVTQMHVTTVTLHPNETPPGPDYEYNHGDGQNVQPDYDGSGGDRPVYWVTVYVYGDGSTADVPPEQYNDYGNFGYNHGYDNGYDYYDDDGNDRGNDYDYGYGYGYVYQDEAPLDHNFVNDPGRGVEDYSVDGGRDSSPKNGDAYMYDAFSALQWGEDQHSGGAVSLSYGPDVQFGAGDSGITSSVPTPSTSVLLPTISDDDLVLTTMRGVANGDPGGIDGPGIEDPTSNGGNGYGRPLASGLPSDFNNPADFVEPLEVSSSSRTLLSDPLLISPVPPDNSLSSDEPSKLQESSRDGDFRKGVIPSETVTEEPITTEFPTAVDESKYFNSTVMDKPGNPSGSTVTEGPGGPDGLGSSSEGSFTSTFYPLLNMSSEDRTANGTTGMSTAEPSNVSLSELDKSSESISTPNTYVTPTTEETSWRNLGMETQTSGEAPYFGVSSMTSSISSMDPTLISETSDSSTSPSPSSTLPSVYEDLYTSQQSMFASESLHDVPNTSGRNTTSDPESGSILSRTSSTETSENSPLSFTPTELSLRTGPLSQLASFISSDVVTPSSSSTSSETSISSGQSESSEYPTSSSSSTSSESSTSTSPSTSLESSTLSSQSELSEYPTSSGLSVLPVSSTPTSSSTSSETSISSSQSELSEYPASSTSSTSSESSISSSQSKLSEYPTSSSSSVSPESPGSSGLAISSGSPTFSDPSASSRLSVTDRSSEVFLDADTSVSSRHTPTLVSYVIASNSESGSTVELIPETSSETMHETSKEPSPNLLVSPVNTYLEDTTVSESVGTHSIPNPFSVEENTEDTVTSESVETRTMPSLSYVTHYQYITATEIITLEPSSLSMSRVVVTISPVYTEVLDELKTEGELGIEAERSLDTQLSMVSSTLMYQNEQLVTQMAQGHTVVQNRFTTITLRSTSTILPDPRELAERSAKRRRRVGLGCGLGLGIPLVAAVALTTYFVFIRSRKVDSIDPEGKIVTSYKMNKFKRMWYMLLGKELPDYYADAPAADLEDNGSESGGHPAYGSRRSSRSVSSGSGGGVFNEKVEEPGAAALIGAAPVDPTATPTVHTTPAGFGTGFIASVVDDNSTVSSESFAGPSPVESHPGYTGGFLYEDIPHDYYNYNHVSINDSSVERRDTDGYLSSPNRVSRAGSSGVRTSLRTGSSSGGNSNQDNNQDNVFSDAHAY